MFLFTCGEAAGPRRARVVVVVVVVGPNQVMYLIANQSLTTNSLWGGIHLSQIRFLFRVGSSAKRSDFLKRSLSRRVYFSNYFLKLCCCSRRSLNKVCSCVKLNISFSGKGRHVRHARLDAPPAPPAEGALLPGGGHGGEEVSGGGVGQEEVHGPGESNKKREMKKKQHC